ncbi:MAG: low molecular weight protein-tyrosine-phosphatase [Maritimibacter sp.]
MSRVLFVCLGNICRSPSAEGVFRAMGGAAHDIDSAGTSGWHSGEAPYGPMQDAARARGYALEGLRARQFSARDFDDFDLIIAMDRDNLEAIESVRPAGARTPVSLFTDYAPETGMDHVPDPYYTRDFDGVLSLIEVCSRGLLAALEPRI